MADAPMTGCCDTLTDRWMLESELEEAIDILIILYL
jgi:hypothetical protein